MHEDRELKIKLYIYPILFFALGSIGLFNPGWEIFGVLMFGLGFVVSLHIIAISLIRERENYMDAEARKIAEQRQLYDSIAKLDPESRYYLGLGYTPKEVTVKVDKTAVELNEYSQTWKKIPLAPYKLKIIAQAALNGEGFTVRKWAGEGKLLSREEWDAAHKTMVDLGMLEPVGDDPRTGFMWTSFGEDVLAQIVKDTL